MKRPLVVVGLFVLAQLLILGCRGQFGPDPLGRARELVAIGDTREKAVDVLGSESWYFVPLLYGRRGRHRSVLLRES